MLPAPLAIASVNAARAFSELVEGRLKDGDGAALDDWPVSMITLSNIDDDDSESVGDEQGSLLVTD